MTLALVEQVRPKGNLRIMVNPASAAVLILFAAYCITPLWAADKGMAWFALPRYFPLVLYVLLIQQRDDDIQQQTLDIIPASGCIMTVVSILALLLPDLQSHVTVNGRLAGLFQYPNSFAAFLLIGLIVQSFRHPCRHHCLTSSLLVSGIVLSGSKTVFLLMIVFMVAIILSHRKLLPALVLSIALILGIAAGFLADSFGLLPNADRFTSIQVSSGTFLVRLLYFRDVIPFILTHPFGIGYMGYPAVEGLIQTGRYYVTYIHNGFLQILLEVGWFPGLILILLMVSAVFLSKTTVLHKFILLAVLSHCMLDFDLQFCVFWIILLSCLRLNFGREILVIPQKAAYCLSAVLVAVCLWLGSGDWLFRSQKSEHCLYVTPFHTEALAYELTDTENPDQLDRLADKILALNPTHSLASSAKANVAFSRGDIATMIRYKEQAIQFSRYTTAEYCHYFDMLYTAMQLYLQTGDVSSAAYCRDKLLQIPEMMDSVSIETHFLAGLTGDDSSLLLPPEYQTILDSLSS